MYSEGSAKDIIVPIQFLEEGKDWSFDRYVRKNGVIKPFVERPSKQVPPKTRKKLTQIAREKAKLAQRRIKRQRGQS
jgi:hypothetical protein